MSTSDQFFGRLQSNWRTRARERTTFRNELRVIPRWLITVLIALYIAALVITESVFLTRPDLLFEPLAHSSVVLRVLGVAGIVTGIAIPVSMLVLLIGYIGADAKRRGMNPVLWVIVSAFVPYFIGVIIYFVVREPLPFSCPQCGAQVTAGFNYCPRCQCNLRPNCGQCRREVRVEDHFCPYCGFALETSAPPPAVPANVQTTT